MDQRILVCDLVAPNSITKCLMFARQCLWRVNRIDVTPKPKSIDDIHVSFDGLFPHPRFLKTLLCRKDLVVLF